MPGQVQLAHLAHMGLWGPKDFLEFQADLVLQVSFKYVNCHVHFKCILKCSINTYKIQAYRVNLEDWVTKERMESLVILEPLVPQACPVISVNLSAHQVHQGLQETLG